MKSIVESYREIREAQILDTGDGGERGGDSGILARKVLDILSTNMAGLLELAVGTVWKYSRDLHDQLVGDTETSEEDWRDESGRDGNKIYVDYERTAADGRIIPVHGELNVEVK